MGGWGSTRWGGHTKAPTVESSFVLDVRSFVESGHDLVDSGLVTLSGHRFNYRLRTNYFVDLVAKPAMLHVSTEFIGHSVTAHIELIREPRHFGGFQLYFRCPGGIGSSGCGRVASKLYLPMEHPDRFACRRCHRLTYETAQEKGTSAATQREARLAEMRQRLREVVQQGTERARRP